MTRLGKLTATAIVAALPASAIANDRDETSVSLTATVPVVCEIDTDALVISSGQTQLTGSVFEMCNNGSGFRVVASHRALDRDEQVQMNYAGHVSMLSSSGFSEVANRPGARIGAVPVSIIGTELRESLAVSLAITAT